MRVSKSKLKPLRQGLANQRVGIGQHVKNLKRAQVSAHHDADKAHAAARKLSPHGVKYKTAHAEAAASKRMLDSRQASVTQARKTGRAQTIATGVRIGKKGGRFHLSTSGKKTYLKRG